MAAGWMRHLAGSAVDVYSGGSQPAAEVNPTAVAAMREIGIDIAAEIPRRWDQAMMDSADVVVTMGCGDECPIVPGALRLDWPVADPAGATKEQVRQIRDELGRRVRDLLGQIARGLERSGLPS